MDYNKRKSIIKHYDDQCCQSILTINTKNIKNTFVIKISKLLKNLNFYNYIFLVRNDILGSCILYKMFIVLF